MMNRQDLLPITQCSAETALPDPVPEPVSASTRKGATTPSANLSCPAPAALTQQTIDIDFNGGDITTNGGVQLLRLADQRLGLVERLAAGFQDGRDPKLVVHHLHTLLRQRLYGLALGHEDLNDHDELRRDKALQASLGLLQARRADCQPLAGKSTLNRLELAAAGTDKAKARKIGVDFQQLDELLVELFVESYRGRRPRKIVIDLDATDVPLYGEQEERFYQGHYKEYCYMPLLFLVGQQPVLVRLRSAAHEAAAGVETELEWLLERLQQAWPKTRMIVRTDAGFCREEIMAVCERMRVDYVLGLAVNPRLKQAVAEELAAARAARDETGGAARRYRDFKYRTLESWSRERRVVGKAEALPGNGAQSAKDNARFVVTSLVAKYYPARTLYEGLYCARGNAENRVKEHKVHLFSKRCSCNLFDANTLRFYLATFALLLFRQLRRALRGTPLRRALPQTLRRDLLRIGAQVRVSTRRIVLALATSFPHRETFVRAWRYLLTPVPS